MTSMLTVMLAGLLLQAKDRPKQGEGVEPGKPAPAWKLKSQDGKAEVDSEKLKGRPYLLIFGSYT
jgi:cytochrome oxidase Cu insertion factor (SCO1/SenC/PrrC family)